MAMMKAGLAGAALGALGLATVMFVAPIAAQAPGGTAQWGDGWRGPGSSGGGRSRGPDDPDMRGPGTMGQRGGDITGPGPGRPGRDGDDGDITGPRGGDVATCQERLAQMARWRFARIQRLVRPTDEQRGAFEELRMASARALEIVRAACPTERPLTPPARMAAAEKWLEARLQAVKVVRPALDNFYKLLSDEQKIRWSLGSGSGRGMDAYSRGLDRPAPGFAPQQDGGDRRMDRGFGGPGRELPDERRERRPDRFERDRDAGPPERWGNRPDDDRSRRPPDRWDDRRRGDERGWGDNRRRDEERGGWGDNRRRDEERGGWGDNRRRAQPWDGSGDEPDEERL
jgi:hypothetical protein